MSTSKRIFFILFYFYEITAVKYINLGLYQHFFLTKQM